MQDIKEMREVYCESLVEMAKTNKDICVVEADLTNCIKTGPFKVAYPDRFFNVGIAEANMVGICAGMSTCGKIPFCSSFGTFASRRCFDQFFISVAYAKQNVKLIGTDSGVTAEYNGGTHMPLEDMAMMRSVPNLVCVEPTDATMLKSLMPQIANYNGAVYMRFARKKQERVFEDNTQFDLFKAIKVREGKDATVIASGIEVAQAVKAAEILAQQGIEITILNTFTWKPIDEDAIVSCAKETGAIVVAENHNRINGLFAAVADVLARKYPTPMESIACQDKFGQVGKLSYLMEQYNLRDTDIVNAVKKAIERKSK